MDNPDPVAASRIKPKRVEWIWRDRLPKGMIAVVASDDEPAVRQAAQDAGIDTWIVGRVVEGSGVRLA